jgi:hypothetical protein
VIGLIAMLVSAPLAFLYSLSVRRKTPGRLVAKVAVGMSAVEFIGVTLLFLPVFASNLGVRW